MRRQRRRNINVPSHFTDNFAKEHLCVCMRAWSSTCGFTCSHTATKADVFVFDIGTNIRRRIFTHIGQTSHKLTLPHKYTAIDLIAALDV